MRPAVDDQRQRLARKRVTLFLVVTFGLSVLALVLMSVSQVVHQMMFLVYGWVPAAAAAVTVLATQGSLRELGLWDASAKYVTAGYGLGWLVALAAYVPAWAGGLATLAPSERIETSGSLLDSQGAPWLALAGFVILYGTLGVLFGSVLALGEEIGWRGLLVPELARLTSFAGTGALSGVIWAVWHLPIMVLFGYHSRAPIWYGVSCAVVAIFLAGFPYAWLRLMSGSVWTVAVFHGTHNVLFQEVFHGVTRETPARDYYVGEFGVLVLIPVSVLALAAWRLRSRLPAPAPGGTAGP